MSGAYRIEVSPNNRAGCKNTECKKEGIKIQKGQLRFGTFITTPDWQSWAWKHWGCVTPRVISNLKEGIEGDPSQLDGYDELPEDYQEKVVKALEQGHIDDEDWGWDIEMNREGKNGYFTLESKRRLKAEAQALKEENAGEESTSPSTTHDKKRGHVNHDPDAEGSAEAEPPAKKTKARTKKETKIKNEDADGGSESEGSTTKKTKPRIKKEPKIKNEDADGGSENEGSTTKKTKPRIKKEPKIKNEDADGGSENEGSTTMKTKPRIKKEPKIKNEDADGVSENEGSTTKKTKPRIKKEPKTKNEDTETRSEKEGPADKKTKAAVKKGKNANDDKADGDFKLDDQSVKKGGKQAKKATAGDEAALHIKNENSDHDTLPPHIAKKTRAPRKAATAKKIKDEDTETDDLDPAFELETPLGNVKLEHNIAKKTRAPRKAATAKKIKDEDTETDDLDPASDLEAPLGNVKLEHTPELEVEANEDAPKLQKGRKKAPKKAAHGSREETNKEVKAKATPAAPRSNGRVTRSRPA